MGNPIIELTMSYMEVHVLVSCDDFLKSLSFILELYSQIECPQEKKQIEAIDIVPNG